MYRKSEFLHIALDAVQAAEKVIMEFYGRGSSFELKDDQSPVSNADILAETVIRNVIEKHFPDHNFWGEEFGKRNKSSEYVWIIDPIDGTKNFIRGIPLFATQIALMKGEEVILGISNAPALKELLYAEKNHGAYCNFSQISTSKTDTIEESYISFGNLKYFENNGTLQDLLNLVKVVRNPRGVGDAWSYHLLSQGKIDVMIDAETKIWDIAAVKIIVEEAGGKVTDFQGNCVLKNITSIIATNAILHEAIQARLRGSLF